MRTKLLTMFATLAMLVTGSANAQSFYWYVGEEIPTPENYSSLAQSVVSLEELPFPYVTTESLMPLIIFAPSECRTVVLTAGNKGVSMSDITSESKVSGYNCYKITAASAGAKVYIASPEKYTATSMLLLNKEITLTENDTVRIKAFPRFYAFAAYDQTVTWYSNDESVATVDNNGLVTALSTGTTTLTVTANDGSGVSATCVVTVEAAAVEEPELTEQYYYYLGTSPDESLITPDNYKEFCQKVSEFPAEQQIVSVDDEYLYVVLPADKDMLALDIDAGIGELNFKYYSSALSKYIPTKNKNVRLTFDDEKVYVIYRSAATALGRYGVNIKEETPVTSIVLDCTEASMQVGESIDITATVNPQDATWYKVMWSSDNASVATVDNNGKVTALAEGSATITAEACDNSGITATCVVTVEAAAVEPEAKYYWYLGTEKLLTDEEVEEKGSKISSVSEIVNPLVLESDEFVYFYYPKAFGKAVLTQSGLPAAGKDVVELTGVSLINYSGWRFPKYNEGGITDVTFIEPEYTVSLDQTNVTLAVGESVTLTATVTPEGATTESMWWQVYDTNIATVENGVVTAVSEGSTRIIVHVGDYVAACQVTVEAAAVEEPEGLIAGKNYRVKNVTTGLYLQVEGNNTNMKLQNKADGVELSQVFQLEDAGEGMYYIKAADSDNNYYAHASGWNFNATANAANKTPFTIALVEGEEGVYTLHQSVSTYKGLAGTDTAEAGAAIYCNKGVDNNGKWAFEALTEEENAIYVTTLTATAKAALDAAIARGEEVVANRSAVLTAEETAAINNAVQAAKEGKDAAADVTALKALSDAIHTAVDEAVYVWNTDALSNAMCYAVSTEDRGAWYAQASNLTSTAKAEAAVDVTDKQQFAFVQSPETGALYLYSVSEEKFVKAEGGYTALTEDPVQTITILNGTRSAQFPWVVALNAEDGQKQMGISNGYDPAVITHYNDLGDAGNTVRIEKVAAFDASAALAAIGALETGINKLTNDNSQMTIYDLQGRKVENPAKGIYIVGGRKVVIK